MTLLAQPSPTIESVLRQINQELLPQFAEKLRGLLVGQDREWLMDQIVRLTLNAQHPQDPKRHEAQAQARAARVARLRDLRLNPRVLESFLGCAQAHDRARLIAEGYLLPDAPAKGTGLISGEHRTAQGDGLLELAKDMLYGLLFGDASTGTMFERTQRELLTLTLPRFKAHALDFMQAATELSAAGTWQDPHSVSNDTRADNVILEIEYGETDDELIGNGIVRCLSLINTLEVNEQVLYARMVDVEQSTLIG